MGAPDESTNMASVGGRGGGAGAEIIFFGEFLAGLLLLCTVSIRFAFEARRSCISSFSFSLKLPIGLGVDGCATAAAVED